MIRTALEALADERARTILPERPIGWPLVRKEIWLAESGVVLWVITMFVLEAK